MAGKIIESTWADLGYRQMGDLANCSGGGRKMVEMVETVGQYETQSGGWIRHRARKRGRTFASTRIAAELTQEDINVEVIESLVEQHADWKRRLALPGIIPVTAPVDELAVGIEEFESDVPWRFLKHLASALVFAANAQDLKFLLQYRVLPAFFRRYPAGRILVIRHGYAHHAAGVVMRAMYTAAQVAPDRWFAEGVNGFNTLRQWHGQETDELVQLFVHVANHLWYPYVTGFLAGDAGIPFLFIPEPAELYEAAPFPRDWLAIPAMKAGYGEQQRNFYQALAGGLQDPEHRLMAHRRLLMDSPPTHEEQLEFLRWLVPTADRLVLNLSDVSNFTHDAVPTSAIDPLLAFEHSLTVERLLRRVLAALSVSEVATAKTIVFEIADLLGALSVRFKHVGNEAEFFKGLFNPSEALSRLEPRLSVIPGVGNQLLQVARHVYANLRETIQASIWVRSKALESHVLVRDRRLRNEIEEPLDQFVANVMRAFRNAHHGYFSEPDDAKRPSRYLWLVDGNMPDSITTLPALWLLAYLADQEFVGWRVLPISAYD